jgi:hypothetical protein
MRDANILMDEQLTYQKMDKYSEMIKRKKVEDYTKGGRREKLFFLKRRLNQEKIRNSSYTYVKSVLTSDNCGMQI